jgi:hypothetical protein
MAALSTSSNSVGVSAEVQRPAGDVYRLPNLKAIVLSMDPEDSSFIQNVAKYVATLDRNNEKNMKILSNTRLPTRFLFSIQNIPAISLNELYKIECMNSNIRHIFIDVLNSSIKVDVWKKKCATKGKRKRSDSPTFELQSQKVDWNLEGLREEDRKACKSILDGVMDMPEILCQFKIEIEEDPPQHYILKLFLKDTIVYSQFRSLKMDFRAFIESIEFNFHEKTVLIVIKRV